MDGKSCMVEILDTMIAVMLQNATEELKRLEAAFNHVRQGLFSRLHDIVREQIFVSEEAVAPAAVAESRESSNGSNGAHAPPQPSLPLTNGSSPEQVEAIPKS